MCDSGLMTRSTMQTSTPEAVDLEAESPGTTDPSRALRLAQATALGLARGTGNVARSGGRLLGRGCAAAKAGLERSAAVPVAVRAEDVVAAPAGRGRRLRPFLLVGAAVAAVAAGVAVWRMRRPEPAPVADRPPSLGDIDTPEQTN